MKAMPPYFRNTLFCIALMCIIPPVVQGKTDHINHIDKKNKFIFINKIKYIKCQDNEEFKNGAYDDSGWKIGDLNINEEGDRNCVFWFRAPFYYEKRDNSGLALLIGDHAAGTEIYLNGEYLGFTGLVKNGKKIFNARGKTYYRYMPHSLLKPGKNVIALRTQSLDYMCGPSELYVGEDHKINIIFRIHEYSSGIAMGLLFFLSIVFIIFYFSLFKREPFYLYTSFYVLSCALFLAAMSSFAITLYHSQYMFNLISYTAAHLGAISILNIVSSFYNFNNFLNLVFRRIVMGYYIVSYTIFLVELNLTGGLIFFNHTLYYIMLMAFYIAHIYNLIISIYALVKRIQYSAIVFVFLLVFIFIISLDLFIYTDFIKFDFLHNNVYIAAVTLTSASAKFYLVITLVIFFASFRMFLNQYTCEQKKSREYKLIDMFEKTLNKRSQQIIELFCRYYHIKKQSEKEFYNTIAKELDIFNESVQKTILRYKKYFKDDDDLVSSYQEYRKLKEKDDKANEN